MAFEFLKKALSESNGQPSSARVFSGWAIFWFVLGLTFGFVWVVLHFDSLIIQFAGILAMVIAGVLGIKVWQKSKEANEVK